MAILVILSFMATRRMQRIPGNLQSLFEIVIGSLYEFFQSVAGDHTRKYFPVLASLFLFIVTANWLGLLPGVGTIGITHSPSSLTETHETVPSVGVEGEHGELDEEHSGSGAPIVDEHAAPAEDSHETVGTESMSAGTSAPLGDESDTGHAEPALTPIFRPATADINTTLAFAVAAVLAIQYFGFTIGGFHYTSRFLDFKSPINFFVGILEFFSELSKIISFAFRLFGNVFAGEVLLTVMAFLIPVIVPMPFILMELFVGFIQALVFSMLTAVFLNVAVSHAEHAAHEHAHAHAETGTKGGSAVGH